jgi:2-hydroxychromene-2-carboxylate isomerase
MKHVDFYFDFMSPYAYLASTRLPALVQSFKGRAEFDSHAIDLVAARFAAGNNGPFNRNIPRKIKYLMADLARWSKRYGVPLVSPSGMDTARLQRGFWCAKRRGAGDAYMQAGFRETWGKSGDPNDDALIRRVAEAAGVPGGQLIAEVDSPEIVALYDNENRTAQERGVFGVPIFIADGQMYWGNDRIEFLEEYLRAD